MSARFRTRSGGRIDRSKAIRFEFDGTAYGGYAGDTLASALLANGVHLVGRSFKYHRPRGILAAGSEEPNALVSCTRDPHRYTPNLLATRVEIYDGLRAHSQNRWPSLTFDIGAVTSLFAAVLPAGFYYKTFKWPRRAWQRLYEPAIRAAAGLGRAPQHADPDRYATRYAHCDVLIVGAGPAGLAAALAAEAAGARVILCDEQAELGGSLLDEQPASAWLGATLDRLQRSPRVTLLPRTTAFGYFPHNFLGLCQRLSDHLERPPEQSLRERLWQVRAKEVVLAAGAIERPLVFPGNDRPGILLAGAARTYLNRFGVIPGRRAVMFLASDEAYRTALDLHKAGVEIATIVDARTSPAGTLFDAARAAHLPIEVGGTIIATRGRLRVSSVTIATGNEQRRVACDVVLMSAGYTPSVHLFSQSRGKLAWRDDLQAFVPSTAAERVRCAGACRGVYALTSVLDDGTAAGTEAAYAALDIESRVPVSTNTVTAGADGHVGNLQPTNIMRSKAFVDWQNDVTARDIELAAREGFRSIEHVKRYTTNGMATDQGKTSNLNALGIVSQQLGKTVPDVGLTTFRMPYTPTTFGSFAGFARGALFDPIRTTPMHAWAARHGAVFEDVGLWKRARYFPRDQETMDEAVARECLAVRAGCGMFDASTLGKIEVTGPDAETFMNMMYVNDWSTLSVGRARYGLMLRDDGFIFDDGVVARTAADSFHVTTTTGGAARVLARMEDYLQTEWPALRVWLTSTTEQWAVIAVQGPQARRVLEPLVEGIDLSAGAMPHMSIARGRICGVPLLLFRVSFTGELGFEVNVPADFGLAVWEAIHDAGHQHGIVCYGTETMHVLRAEKGYIVVGQDTDGTVTPHDAGLAWTQGKNKIDFIGKRSLARAAMKTLLRKQLVGLSIVDARHVIDEGSQVMQSRNAPAGLRPLGHVTSSYFSAVLGRPIALALVAGGRARMGQSVWVPTAHGDVEAAITAPTFYDPDGKRLHA